MVRRIPLEQRREELVAAAIRVISRDGVGKATTRRIVAEAEMPLGAFHYAFASQDELMRAVVETVTEQERFAAQAGSLDARSLESALLSGFGTYIALLEANPERELVLMELAFFSRRHTEDGMRAQWSTYFESAAEMLSYAAELTGSEWTSPLDELARLLVALLDGITLAWLADRDSAAARRTAEFAASGLAAHARSISD